MASWRKLVNSQFSVDPPSLLSSSPPPENSTASPPAIAWRRSSVVMKYNMLVILKPCALRNLERDQHRGTFFLTDLAEKARNYLSHNELLEIVQCKLEEAKSDNVSIESLTSLEEQFKTALSVTRARKTELTMELVKTLQEKEKLLREHNQGLASQLTKMEKKSFMETEDERAMTPENSSGNNQPETLSLLK